MSVNDRLQALLVELQSEPEVHASSAAAEARHSLLKRASEALQQQEGLLETTRRILRGESFQNIARALFDQACRQIGATSGYVALLSDDGTENQVLFLEAGGLPCTVDPSLPMPIRGLREQAYRSGRAVCDNDFMHSPWVSMMPAGHVVLNNVLFAPLNVDGKTVGIIGLANKPTDFTPEDLQQAEVIGDLAALALSHWRKNEALNKLAKDYQTIFREMIDGFALHEIICDTQGQPVDYRFLAVNPAFERLTGLNAKDLIGRTVLEVMPNTEKHWIDTYGKVALTGEPAHFHNVAGALGKMFEVNAFRPEPGKFACIFVDVTAHHKAEAELRSTRDFLENLINHANAPIIVWDPAFRITRFNQAFEKMTGRTAAEVAGKHIDLLFPPNQVDASMRLIAKTLSGERLQSVEMQIQHISGTISTVLWNSATIFDPTTRVPVATIAQGHDITIRLQKVQELRAAHARLEALWSITSLSNADVKKISDHILMSLSRMTGSHYGFYGFVSPDEQVMTIHSWSGEAMKDCSMVTRPSQFAICKAGIWAEAVRRREPLILNDYEASHPAKKGLPVGHVQLTKLLVVPFFSHGRITAVAAVANRATDYTQEDVSQINAFLNSIQAITEGKRAEQALRESEERYRTVANFTYDWEYWISPDHAFLYCSPACERITGYTPHEFAEKPRLLIEIVHPEDRNRVDHHLSAAVECHVEHHTDEFRIITKSGETRWIGHACQIVRDTTGQFRGRRASNRDITTQKMLQQQLLQAQKLESIGTLAGGVAHDFNNMLGVIIGRTENAMHQLSADNPAYADLEEIMRSARHSAELTGQLLAFARKQSAIPVVGNLNVMIDGTMRMLRRLIGENIRLDWEPAIDLWNIKIDSGQMDQILTNLVVNARDAISGSGVIRLRTSNETLSEPPSHLTGHFEPGEYVCLALTDSGCGMSTETIERIFEPFFTTKETGKGTGLGLATVFDIVSQNHGQILVSSTPGRGTTFSLYFPRCREALPVATQTAATETRPEAPIQVSRTVLLVEDEPSLLEISKLMLERSGFKVLAAASSEAAIRLEETCTEPIDLLMTDIMLPDMNGRDLHQRLITRRPHLKTLFMSGYTADIIARQGLIESGIHFLQKPFNRRQLEEALKEIFRTSS